VIEIVYSKENDKKDEYLRLPKNIRQIGIPNETRKVYIEDYAITFINQLAARCMDEPRAAVLVGNTTYNNSCEYIFIGGVVEVDDVKIDTDSIDFTEKTWTGIYNKIKKYFPNQDIVGWFLSSQAFHRESSDHIIKAHIDNFAGSDKVFMKIDPLENEEIFYVFQNGHFVRQMGYYIYYEKNEEMQEYMVQGKEKDREKEERPLEQVEDHAAKSFRSIIQERKDEKHQKKMTTFMYSTSTFLVMIVVVIGITMINNYDKMKSMEQTLNSISRVVNNEDEKIATDWFADNKEQSEEESNSEQAATTTEDLNVEASTDATQEVMNQSAIPVENVAGNVEKQEEPTQENTEQSSTDQTTTEQATTDQTATQQTAGTVTEVTSSEEEVKQNLEASSESSTSQEESTQVAAQPKTYTVQKGDTLAKISLKLYNTQDMVSKICELNNIQNDNKIQAGQTLLLP
jgi:LysM repeat protein